MARIPVYQEQQSVGQSMGVRQVSAPNVDTGAIGRSVQQLGQAVGQMAQAHLKVEEENAKAWVANASADSALQWTTRLKEMQENTEPGARNFTSNLAKEFDPWADEMVKSAPDRASRRFLQQSLVNLRQSVLSSAIAFEATEGRNHRFALMKDGITKAAQVVYTDPTEMNLHKLMGEQEALIDSLNDTPTRKAQLRETLLVAMGRAGAEAMARDMPQVLLAQRAAAKKAGRKASGNAFLDLLDPGEWSTYENLAQNNTDALNVESTANTVWNALGPKSDIDPVNKDVMFARIDQEMSDRTLAERKAAKALIDSKAAAFDYSTRQRRASVQGAIWEQVLAGKNLDQIQQTREWKILDGSDKVQLIGQINTFQKSGVDDTQQLSYYLTFVSDPQKLANMSDAEIIAEAPKLGQTLTKDLLKRKQSLNDPNNVQAATIDEDTFKRLANEAGLKPYDTRLEEKDRAALGRLKYAVEQKIDIEQQTLKRKLTPQEKEKIMQQEISNTVMVSVFGRDKETPIALVETDKLGDTYVVVDGKEVYLNTIPATSREKIVRQLRAAGRPVTERAIAEVFVLSKRLPSPEVEMSPR